MFSTTVWLFDGGMGAKEVTLNLSASNVGLCAHMER